MDLANLLTLFLFGLIVQQPDKFTFLNYYSAGLLIIVIWVLRSIVIILTYKKIYIYLSKEEARWRDLILFDTLIKSYSEVAQVRGGSTVNTLITECRKSLDGLFATADFIQSIVSLIIISIAAFIISPLIILPALIALVLTKIEYLRNRRKRNELGIKQMHHNEQYSNIISESQRCAKDLRVLNLRQSIFDNAKIHNEQSSFMFGQINLAQHESKAVVELLFILSISISFFILDNILTKPDNFISVIFFMVGAAFRSMPYLTRANMSLIRLGSSQKEMNKIARILNMTSNKEFKFNNFSIPKIKWQNLSLENVSFSYGKQKVFNSVSLNIKFGNKIIFFGPSGHGKSTLIDILTGLLTPNKGIVKVDGIDIKESGVDTWLSSVGYLSQQPYIFYATVEDNLRLNKNISQEEILDACRLTGFDQVLKIMPEGLDTKIGEQGIGLSGGQKQKLALTRVLLQGYKTIFLDEPSSAMDTKSESELIYLINMLAKKGYTLIIATHSQRLASVGDIKYLVKDGLISKE